LLRVAFSLVALASTLLQGGCDLVEIHAVPDEPFSCENETWNEARINPHRYIAHAGGQIDGRRYTNSREALDLAYENGLRLFEFDLIKTSDGHLVAAHDWDWWRNAARSTTTEPTHQQFKELLLFEAYQTLDLADLDRWFAEHADSYLVTDKVTDFAGLLDGFAHNSRLIVEVFSVDDFRRARKEGVRHPMLSLGAALGNDGEDEIISLLQAEPVKFAAVSRKDVRRTKEMLARMRRNETCVYVFTSNEPEYMTGRFENVVYGAYTDSWSVNTGGCTAAPCDTY
jgi:glycerophosphoryl diester phosphodiesterase